MSRRHAHLTLEHLLFAVANEVSGEKILRAAGADTTRLREELDRFLDDNVEVMPLGSKRAPEQTLAFRRVLQTAVLHVQSAGKTEADVGDILAALLAQPRSYAVDLYEQEIQPGGAFFSSSFSKSRIAGLRSVRGPVTRTVSRN